MVEKVSRSITFCVIVNTNRTMSLIIELFYLN